MTETEAIALLKKYKTGTCNADERAMLESWYLQWNEGEGDQGSVPFNEAYLNNLHHELWEAMPKPLVKKTVLWKYITAAASILIFLAVGLHLTLSQYSDNLQHIGVYANDVRPGSNKAYLTLGNGKRIVLTGVANGELAEESGVQISKTTDGELIYTAKESTLHSSLLNTIETPKGGQYKVRLPDGTMVWLNAASKLIYPVSFATQKDRRIELSGEAYFEVAKDKAHPFKVKSGAQEIEVLGTHFNMNSYADEGNIKTTLLEGSVRVTCLTAKGTLASIVLKPGEQSVQENEHIKIMPADVDAAIAWKNALFVFDNDNLENILKKVSRWYDVEIVYLNQDAKQEVFSGRVSRFGNVSEVLRKLSLTGAVKFNIEGRRILVGK